MTSDFFFVNLDLFTELLDFDVLVKTLFEQQKQNWLILMAYQPI